MSFVLVQTHDYNFDEIRGGLLIAEPSEFYSPYLGSRAIRVRITQMFREKKDTGFAFVYRQLPTVTEKKCTNKRIIVSFR